MVSFHKCRHNLSLTPMPKHVVRTLLISSIRVSTLCPAAAPQRLPLKRVFMHSPPTIIAWIADYRHGTRRFSLPAGKRMHCELLREPWFVNRLALHGALPQLDSSDLWLALVVIRGLVSVAKGECWTTLAPTICEAELLWRYFGRPLDLFTLQVQRRWALTAPAEAHVQQRGSFLGFPQHWRGGHRGPSHRQPRFLLQPGHIDKRRHLAPWRRWCATSLVCVATIWCARGPH